MTEKKEAGELESIRVTVAAVAMDPDTNTPLVLLKEDGGDRILPILIGLMEAYAIASELEKRKPPRPMTHDLLRDIIMALGASVEKVEVVDLRENTFYAIITLKSGSERRELDSRPSDAIALALRCGASIWVRKRVFDLTEGKSDKEEAKDKWKDILENLSPEAFGKYKM